MPAPERLPITNQKFPLYDALEKAVIVASVRPSAIEELSKLLRFLKFITINTALLDYASKHPEDRALYKNDEDYKSHRLYDYDDQPFIVDWDSDSREWFLGMCDIAIKKALNEERRWQLEVEQCRWEKDPLPAAAAPELTPSEEEISPTLAMTSEGGGYKPCSPLYEFVQAFDFFNPDGIANYGLLSFMLNLHEFVSGRCEPEFNITSLWEVVLSEAHSERSLIEAIKKDKKVLHQAVIKKLLNLYMGKAWFLSARGEKVKLSDRMMRVFTSAELAKRYTGLERLRIYWSRVTEPLEAVSASPVSKPDEDDVLRRFEGGQDISVFRSPELGCLLAHAERDATFKPKFTRSFLCKYPVSGDPIGQSARQGVQGGVSETCYPLVVAVEAEPRDFLQLVGLLSDELLEGALHYSVSPDSRSLLSRVARYQPEENFLEFIGKLGQRVLDDFILRNETITLQYNVPKKPVKKRVSTFEAVLFQQSSRAVLALIERLSNDSIKQLARDSHMLSSLFSCHRSEVVLRFLEKIQFEYKNSIEQIYNQWRQRGYLVTRLVDLVARLVYFQTSDVVLYFLELMNYPWVNKEILWNIAILYNCLRMHSERVILQLINRIENISLDALLVVVHEGEPLFYFLVELQDITSLNALMDKLGSKRFKKLMCVTLEKLKARQRHIFFKSLSKRLCHPDCKPELFNVIKDYMKDLYPFLEEQVFKLNIVERRSRLIWVMVDYLLKLSDHTPMQLGILQFFHTMHHSTIHSYRQYLKDMSSKEGATASAMSLSDLIDGIDSAQEIPSEMWNEIRYFQRLEAVVLPSLDRVTTTVWGAQRGSATEASLFKEKSAPAPDASPTVGGAGPASHDGAVVGDTSPVSGMSQSPAFDRVRDVINSSNGLVKVIKDKHWRKFLQQFMHGYQHRPDLRRINAHLPPPEFKYVHLKDEVVKARHGKRPKESRGATKKSSSTLLSPNLNTRLFGTRHADNRDLVGLLFDRNDCVIKAMFKSDTGTFARQWKGSRDAVKGYAMVTRRLIFTDEQRFKDVIRDEYHLCNELLAKYTVESLTAVVIARETPTALALARRYRDDVRKELGIDLPIVRYDPVLKAVWLVEDVVGARHDSVAESSVPPCSMWRP